MDKKILHTSYRYKFLFIYVCVYMYVYTNVCTCMSTYFIYLYMFMSYFTITEVSFQTRCLSVSTSNVFLTLMTTTNIRVLFCIPHSNTTIGNLITINRVQIFSFSQLFSLNHYFVFYR